LAKKTKRTRKGLFNGLLVKLSAVAAAIGCAVIIFSTEKDCSEKEQELDDLQTKIESFEAENSELQRVLESDDMSAYMEKIAVEEKGYAYPDERRFYDTSRD
jgi:cell division protein FtsB